MQSDTPKIYFNNLNSIRFIAAFLVIIHHVELGKSLAGLPNSFTHPFVAVVGKLGVVLFFVLSGFLITYLLMEEEKNKGEISLSKFYLRRVCRIWPLYFFVFFLSFILSRHTDLWKAAYSYSWINLGMILLFMTNLSRIFFPAIPFFSHTWSVSVEEQFYLFWPVLMKWVKNKWLGIASVILLYIALSLGLQYYVSLGEAGSLATNAFSAISVMNIDCMAIGGLYALIFRSKNKWYGYISSRIMQGFLLVLLVTLVALGVKFPVLHYELYAILFGACIMNMVSQNSVLTIEYRPLQYLGQISYGLYMYHPLVIYPLLTLVPLTWISGVWGYLFVLSLTTAVAALSYHLMEEPFIRLKEKFAVIPSGNKLGK